MLDKFIRHAPKAVFEHFYNGCHFFDFGAFTPDDKICDFGRQLAEKGLLKLPFERVFYNSHIFANTKDQLFALQGQHNIEPLLKLIPHPDIMFEVENWSNIHAVLHDYTYNDISQGCVNLFIIESSNRGANGGGKYKAICYKDKRNIDWNDKNNVQKIHERSVERARALIYEGTTTLISKSTLVAQKAIKNKNALRVQNNSQYPVFSWNTVTINPNHVKTMAAATGQSTHASPRLHWRRGHFRRWKGEFIPVAPCLVGCASNGIIQKDYIVEAA